MDQLWNGNVRAPFVPQPSENSFGFLYNYNYDQFPVLEMKQSSMQESTSQHYNPLLPTLIDHKIAGDLLMIDPNFNARNDPANNKKKRLSNEQLESLENSFQDDIKLDPERKQRLAKELGIEPRQIAVWFQNRRVQWKGKQLERLYDALKKEYNAVSEEKHKLQKEVLALRAILKEQVIMNKQNQLVINYTEISNEETVESTSMIPSGSDDDKSRPMTMITINEKVNINQTAECNYDHVLNVEDDYTQVVMMTPYNNWAA